LILFQDSNSIAKRYLNDEEGIAETKQAMDSAEFLAASFLAYVEVRALLAAANRGKRFRTGSQYSRTLREFEEDWPDYFKISITEELILNAGELAEKRGLRGYDAVQLASALVLRESVADEVQFSTWDLDLNRAAIAEGLDVAHEVAT
jgi:predicted nucleic acid-binding protein